MRIGTKLVLGYASIGLAVAAASLAAVASTGRKLTVLGRESSATLTETTQLSALSESAFEESYAYIVSRNRSERDSSNEKAIEFGRRLRALAFGAPDPGGLFARALAVDRQFAESRQSLFEAFERSGAVPTPVYQSYEQSIDGLQGAMNALIEREELQVKKAQEEAVAVIRTTNALIVGIAALAVLLSLLVGLFLGRRITRPLSALRDSAVAFGRGELDLDATAGTARSDEIGDLARSFSQMAVDLKALTTTLEARVAARTDDLRHSLDELKETQKRLMDASRQAGMAEVATNVLHNVGNVLNSVNVSASVVHGLVRNSRASGIAKVAELLRANGDDLAKLAAHPAGARLPAYIGTLASAVAAEQQHIQAELESLTSKIDHIKVIVSLQQSNAKASGVIERLSMVKVLEDALALRAASSEKHGIEVVLELEDAEIEVDRHKLIQIVTNLLSNAWHAVTDRNHSERRVIIRSRLLPSDMIAVEVEDNGCGIHADALPKIFSHGFTTKADGHGFGLHASACAAAELGGRLSVQSRGPNQGATFTVVLRRKQETRVAA